jgi:ABC-type antimicrobial peptide transport system permease subunit
MPFKLRTLRALLGFRLAGILLISLLGAGSSFAQAENQDKSSPQQKSGSEDKKEPKSTNSTITKIRIMVTGDDKPVGNASVYVRYNEPGGFLHHDKLAEMSFKTNMGGSVKVPEVPRGKVLIQVIAKGWRTFGKWYDIDTDGQTVEIKLEPPPHWY